MYKSDINFNLYKTFYEVARTGSITEAAKKMFTTQPNVSKSIKKLEEDLQVKLFFRNLDGVQLTEKGKELLFYVEEAFNSLITAERFMLEADNLETGKLSIGVPSQIASFYIFDHISEFHQKHPNIEITIVSKSTAQLLSLLESHEIDFIIDTSPVSSEMKNCVIKPVMEIQNCFVKLKLSKLKTTKIESLKDLGKTPLILPIPGTANRIILDKIFSDNNAKIFNVLNIHTSEMIIGAVKKDLGIGYVLYDCVKKELENDEFEIVSINESLPITTINLVYIKKYLTKAPLTFIKKYLDTKV